MLKFLTGLCLASCLVFIGYALAMSEVNKKGVIINSECKASIFVDYATIEQGDVLTLPCEKLEFVKGEQNA